MSSAVAIIKPLWTKAAWKEKGSFYLTDYTIHQERKQKKIVKARAWTDCGELLRGLFSVSWSTFFLTWPKRPWLRMVPPSVKSTNSRRGKDVHPVYWRNPELNRKKNLGSNENENTRYKNLQAIIRGTRKVYSYKCLCLKKKSERT